MTTNTTGEDRSVSGEEMKHLEEMFRDWFKGTGIDFWNEANAPEELAQIAIRFRTAAPTAPSTAGERAAQIRKDALEEAIRCCERAKESATKHYGVAEGVGAEKAIQLIRALIPNERKDG